MNVINQVVADDYAIYNGDSCEVVKALNDESVGYIIYSPPFDSLYTYSNSDRDMGNSEKGEFMDHFAFLAKELFRILKSGRLMSFHCMNLPTSKVRDGFIGIRDFRGELIRLFESVGFIFHSEVCIWKDPVIAQQRTKALGLLHKQLVKDSAMSRQGLADYLVTMRKPGINAEPIEGGLKYYCGDGAPIASKFDEEKGNLNRGSIEVWQRYASPVWMDINPSNTLSLKGSRDDEDEKHICPLQLDVIERALQLWTNEGDVVFTPFLGIGSEVYQSLKMNRKGIGIELKSSYFNKHTPYKLACSATPSPNDYTELGNHTEFLNVMSLSEMLSMYFVHDGGDTSEWILKGHAIKPFWKFISSWAVFFTKPSDLGYSAEEDAKFKLPPLKMQHVEVESQSKGSLFAIAAQTLQERRQAKKDSLEQRCEKVAGICNASNENFLIWCELNDEGAMLKKLVADSVEIKGSDSDEFKARAMSDFANGKIKCLITKPKIAGFGMNWQKHCANVIYASLSDSFEGFFQSLRRVYRYGQTREVTCYIITSEAEANVLANIRRKEAEFYKMIEGCLEQTRELVLSEIKRVSREKSEYNPSVAMSLPEFLRVG